MEPQVVPHGEDKSTGPMQEAFIGLFLSIAFVLVSLRFYVRARIVKKLWWDDFFLLLGLSFSNVVFGLIVASVNSGYGRHIYYLLPKQVFLVLKMEKIGMSFMIFSIMFTKISICLFLLRIFIANRVWRRAMYIIMALIVATNLSSAITFFFLCKPVAKLWNPTIKGTCWSQGTRTAIFDYQGVVSIFTDFLLAFLPIYFFKDVQISLRTKLSICTLMSLGIFTGICGINRIVLLAPFLSSDFTYSGTKLDIWARLEMYVAIIAAAIPALRPLWAKSANQNQRNNEQVRWPNNNQRLNSAYAMMDQQMQADSHSSRLVTRITAQEGQNQGEIGSEATPPPDCNGIMKTSHVSVENFRKCEGKWIPELSSLSDGEMRVEDVV